MKYLTLVLVLFFSVNTLETLAQKEVPEEIEYRQVQRLSDSYIDVYFNVPTKSQLPIILFCQGSGFDSNTEGFLSILRQFEEKAVGLAIEKEGVKLGDSGDSLRIEYLENNLVNNRLNDYLRVLQYMRANAEWWNGDLYIVGGSEGGLLAGMLACYYPDIKGVAIFSFGGGLSFGEAWPIAVGLQKEQEGAEQVEIEAETKSASDTLNLCRSNPVSHSSYSGEDNTYAWWNSIVDLRLLNCLVDLKVPIYLAQGGEDIMSPSISAQATQEQFIDQGKTNMHYREYEGYDHGFSDSEGNSHLIQVVMESIRWILKDLDLLPKNETI